MHTIMEKNICIYFFFTLILRFVLLNQFKQRKGKARVPHQNILGHCATALNYLYMLTHL